MADTAAQVSTVWASAQLHKGQVGKGVGSGQGAGVDTRPALVESILILSHTRNSPILAQAAIGCPAFLREFGELAQGTDAALPPSLHRILVHSIRVAAHAENVPFPCLPQQCPRCTNPAGTSLRPCIHSFILLLSALGWALPCLLDAGGGGKKRQRGFCCGRWPQRKQGKWVAATEWYTCRAGS